MKTLLLTRPQKDSEALAYALAEMGMHSLISPMLEIRPVVKAETLVAEALLREGSQGVLLTSRHALFACVAAKHLPFYVVGESTAQIVGNRGYNVVKKADTALEMMEILPKKLRILYPSGADIRCEFNIPRIIVYHAQAAERFTCETQEAIKKRVIEGVVFYSVRSAETFHGFQPDTRHMQAFCLSQAVAHVCQSLGNWREVRAAPRPVQACLLEIINQAK